MLTKKRYSVKDMVLWTGRYAVAHASTPEGMRRAVLGGVQTIEHGDGGTIEIFELMKENNVALCPTLAAGDAISRYKGWKGDLENDQSEFPIRKYLLKKHYNQALILFLLVTLVFFLMVRIIVN
jgi:hypothetical protein